MGNALCGDWLKDRACWCDFPSPSTLETSYSEETWDCESVCQTSLLIADKVSQVLQLSVPLFMLLDFHSKVPIWNNAEMHVRQCNVSKYQALSINTACL